MWRRALRKPPMGYLRTMSELMTSHNDPRRALTPSANDTLRAAASRETDG
jgi:hypothetical protein